MQPADASCDPSSGRRAQHRAARRGTLSHLSPTLAPKRPHSCLYLRVNGAIFDILWSFHFFSIFHSSFLYQKPI